MTSTFAVITGSLLVITISFFALKEVLATYVAEGKKPFDPLLLSIIAMFLGLFVGSCVLGAIGVYDIITTILTT